MERGIMMLLHSILIGIVLYLFMLFVLKQSKQVAEDRSIIIGAMILIYMILFGHKLPNFNKINKNVF